jgi:hypothetical protein
MVNKRASAIKSAMVAMPNDIWILVITVKKSFIKSFQIILNTDANQTAERLIESPFTAFRHDVMST